MGENITSNFGGGGKNTKNKIMILGDLDLLSSKAIGFQLLTRYTRGLNFANVSVEF